jgi:hypothetical protein
MKHDDDLLKKLDPKDFFWLGPILIMIIGIFPMPIGYYTLLRLVVFVSALYFCFKIYENNKKVSGNSELWFFGLVALLYNPILPVYLYIKLIWTIINIFTIYLFYKYKNIIQNK